MPHTDWIRSPQPMERQNDLQNEKKSFNCAKSVFSRSNTAVAQLKRAQAAPILIVTKKRRQLKNSSTFFIRGNSCAPDFFDAPIFAEAGMVGVDYEKWFGIMARLAFPKGILANWPQRLPRCCKCPTCATGWGGTPPAGPSSPKSWTSNRWIETKKPRFEEKQAFDGLNMVPA